MDEPMTEVEILNAVKNMAKMAWTLYLNLQDEGFDAADALTLTGRWLHGTAGGKVA